MRVGVTGTSLGPTPRQHAAMRHFLCGISMTRFVHGAAPGVDTLAHNIVRACHGHIVIEAHPSNLPARSSTLAVPMGNMEIWPEKPPLDRDRFIVQRIHGLLAVPPTDEEIVRSGTWATVRYAREIGIAIYLIRRDGRIVRDPSIDAPL